MNKQLSILLLVMALLPACKSHKKQKPKDMKSSAQSQHVARVDIPLAGDDLRSFFDQNVDEFTFVDENNTSDVVALDGSETQLAWSVDGQDDSQPIYFDFDKYAVREDQKPTVEHDIEYAKQEVKKNEIDGANPVVVIEGHACHSAGSKVYNLALSNKRAKVVADRFKAEGLGVTTVGRGDEMPAIVNGKPVTGSREQQAPNRRVLVKVVHA